MLCILRVCGDLVPKARVYTEGKASILKGDAFLNPASATLRWISVGVAAYMAQAGTSMLDATAATGIRGIRYYLEAGIRRLTLLEINRGAYAALKANLRRNKVRGEAHNESIQLFANTHDLTFDIIDLDPFGSAVPYLSDIMKLAKDGSGLFITATDTAVLCGAHWQACVKLYGALPMHNELCHEAGLRILLAHVAGVAARYNFGIEPLLSLSSGQYIRLFLRLRRGARHAVESVKSTGYAHYCTACGERGTERAIIPRVSICMLCGKPMLLAGRMWVQSLHEGGCVDHVARFLAKAKAPVAANALIGTLQGEPDVPLYYSVPVETKRLGISSVSPRALVAYLRTNGVKAGATHFDTDAVKTAAGANEVAAALRAIIA